MIRYPDLDVQFDMTNQKLDLVAEGYDLAVRMGRLEDSSMMAKRLSSRVKYVCASPEYLSNYGAPHSLSELDQHNCLQGNLDYWSFDEKGKSRKVSIKGNITCNNGWTLLDAALKGIGIVQLPDYYVEESLKSGKLISLLEHCQEDNEGIWAVYPHNRHLSPKVRMLLEFFSESLS
uniref:LysR substrate-binding domain-containing protein n=1 Tax=uncultured Halomonas sp. TaxID=173971 RepID=UPI0026174FD5|nr:LysR substrate-binding domain-containing protein [uncultured Halomonas sp.]